MILRRITLHLKNQNWFAVWLDITVVVFSVFIGIQVANWNDLRIERDNYSKALKRLSTEVSANLTVLQEINEDMIISFDNVNNAIEALQSCIENKDNHDLINRGMHEIKGTYGVHLRTKALVELTSDPKLLALQTEQERARFSDLMFYFDIALANARWVENHPLNGRFEDNPIVGLGEVITSRSSYYDFDFTSTHRELYLNASVDEACKDNHLTKSFYVWERWQKSLLVYTNHLVKELEITTTMLDER